MDWLGASFRYHSIAGTAYIRVKVDLAQTGDHLAPLLFTLCLGISFAEKVLSKG